MPELTEKNTMSSNTKAVQVLRDTFGYASFRPMQGEVVDAILRGEDVLLILPTGAGKSLCYQLPGLLMDGIVVVVSPLIALMQDQVTGLQSRNIPAAAFNSSQSQETFQNNIAAIRAGQLKFLFVAPERLTNPSFIDYLSSLDIAYFAIDEAHCVSEWGHEFREDYRQLGTVREHFPDVPVAAFTATATPNVERDVVQQLRLRPTGGSDEPAVFRGAVFRNNLHIVASARQGKGHEQLLAFLHQYQQDGRYESGIIYAATRNTTEEIAQMLVSKGIQAQAYHAGMPAQKRAQVQQLFARDELPIVVATIAFGMGIDKSNIRYVVHMALPKSLEAYYQEIGRAGRDGLDSTVLLLSSMADIGRQVRFIEELEDETYKRQAWQRLDVIKRFSQSETCRHRMISEYFGDTGSDCGQFCDNCTAEDSSREDISEAAQMFLSTVYRVHQGFGANHLIDILTGSQARKVMDNSHDQLSVHGKGKKYHKKQWRAIVDRLFELDAISTGEYGEIHLTAVAKPILQGEQQIDIRRDRLQVRDVKAPAPAGVQLAGEDQELFEQLRQLRRELANQASIPAYMVFDDKTLRDMATRKPHDANTMLTVNGVGAIKFEKYGQEFLKLLTNNTELTTTGHKETITATDTKGSSQLPQQPESHPALDTEPLTHSQISPEYNTETQHTPTSLNTKKTINARITDASGKIIEVNIKQQTYQHTLQCVRQGMTLDSVADERGLTLPTIMRHINLLNNAGLISSMHRKQLFSTIPLPPTIDTWMAQGLEQASIDELMQFVSIYKHKHEGEENQIDNPTSNDTERSTNESKIS